ncbi:general stress protein [Paenibacillus xylaniclasticus]|uniref:general stress protein n=1 Tax=Paenibacillus xylaniclasticus TaxID=588083 RepID=UPI0013E066BB|nr:MULTISPECIES: general stress protein [Paenibacillus]GFN33077.1 hypothetical protein PCURB6_33370 [Paenibacillus curdlanolyticus]
MASKIGVFASEREAIHAVQQLLQAGFTPGEMKVIAKDGYHSRALEAESGVHVDELMELVDTREHLSDSDYESGELRRTSLVGNSITTAGITMGSISFAGAAPLAGAAYLSGVGFNRNNGPYDRALSSLGIEDARISACRDAVKSGSTLVVVSTTESKTLLEVDGGPELSVLSNAEAIYRSCGATQIL